MKLANLQPKTNFHLIKVSLKYIERFINKTFTLCEMWPNTELFLVRIFLYSDWIRRFTVNIVYKLKVVTWNVLTWNTLIHFKNLTFREKMLQKTNSNKALRIENCPSQMKVSSSGLGQYHAWKNFKTLAKVLMKREILPKLNGNRHFSCSQN